MTTTLRGRLPILLSECIARNISIKFGFHMKEPTISWTYENGEGSHHHLDNFIPGVHGGNMIEIEKVLVHILTSKEAIYSAILNLDGKEARNTSETKPERELVDMGPDASKNYKKGLFE